MNYHSRAANSNTRLIPYPTLQAHLDYLRVKIKTTPTEIYEVFSLIDHKYLTVEMERPWQPGKNCPHYENRFYSPLGALGGFTVDTEENTAEIMIDFTGVYFSDMDNQDSWRLILGLGYRFKADCSRLDIAVDDESQKIIPRSEMRQAWLDENNFGFRNYKRVESGSNPRKMKTTDYYGSRHSGKMVRVYVHKGKYLRLETEFKRKYARAIFALILSANKTFAEDQEIQPAKMNLETVTEKFKQLVQDCPGLKAIDYSLSSVQDSTGGFEIDLTKILAGLAVGAIDFRDKSRLKDKQNACQRDCPRLEFWEKFRQEIGLGIKIYLPQVESSIEKTVSWLKRQVSKTLTVIKEGLGGYKYQIFMKELLLIGEEKMTLKDSKLAQYIESKPELFGFSSV